MKVALPQNTWAILRSKGEITERVSRELSRALMESTIVTEKLKALGYDDNDVSTYYHFKSLAEDEITALKGIEEALILAFTDQWYWETEINVENLRELPAQCYEALALECLNVWIGEESELDPKADTAA